LEDDKSTLGTSFGPPNKGGTRGLMVILPLVV